VFNFKLFKTKKWEKIEVLEKKVTAPIPKLDLGFGSQCQDRVSVANYTLHAHKTHNLHSLYKYKD
jgi:hypothetical protein